jgi:hypothetical protein
MTYTKAESDKILAEAIAHMNRSDYWDVAKKILMHIDDTRTERTIRRASKVTVRELMSALYEVIENGDLSSHKRVEYKYDDITPKEVDKAISDYKWGKVYRHYSKEIKTKEAASV